jgi:hypothetical protein
MKIPAGLSGRSAQEERRAKNKGGETIVVSPPSESCKRPGQGDLPEFRFCPTVPKTYII